MRHNRTSVGAKKKPKTSNWLISQPFEFTEKQKEIIELLNDKHTHSLFINGPAGTGKTHIAIHSALQHLQCGWVDRLIYVRSIVESAHSPIGMLPGEIESKIGPYMEILKDKLHDMLSAQEIEALERDGKIHGMPCSFLRGKDFKRSIIIVDEAQGLVLHELKTIISRVGEESKIVFLFDPEQSDIRDIRHRHDIVKFSRVFDSEKAEDFGIHYREFTEDDILRSAFCKFVITELKKAKL